MRMKLLFTALAVASTIAIATTNAQAEELSLEGKTIGVTVIGTDHHWDLMA